MIPCLLAGPVAVLMGLAGAAVPAAEIVLRTDAFSLTLDGQGHVSRLTDAAGREYLAQAHPLSAAQVAGQWHPGRLAAARDDRLEMVFGPSGARAVLGCRASAEGLAFRVEAADEAIEALTFLRLKTVSPIESAAGRFLYFPGLVLGLVSAGPAVHLEAGQQRDSGMLQATVYRAFGLKGEQVALLAGAPDRLAEIVGRQEKAFGLRWGIDLKTNEANRRSYLMLSGITAANIDEVIGYAQRGGFGSILMIQGTWANYGQKYAVPRGAWPEGLAQLKAAVDRIHQAGLLAGAHLFSSKVPKVSDYTRPVPDQRLYQDQVATLGQDVDARADRIVTTEPPTGWPLLAGTRDILVDDELMTYTELSLKPPYGFAGLARGAYGTSAAGHKAGARLSHPVTDESRHIFIIDPKTDLLEEVAGHIARTFEGAGFDWIYFDGAEDVPPPHWYHIPVAKLPLLRRLKQTPPILQCAALGTFCWHLTTRAGQRDYFWKFMDAKDEIDDAILHSAVGARKALFAAEIGWFPLWLAHPNRRATQIDEIEYLYTKALAADAAVSIETSVSVLQALPHREAMLHLMNQLERLRLENYFPESVKQRVRTPHQDFMLLADRHGRWHLQPAREVPFVAGTSLQVRAFRAERLDGQDVFSLWNVGPPVRLEFDAQPGTLEFTDYAGQPHPFQELPGARVAVTVDRRLYMRTRPQPLMNAFLRAAKATVLQRPAQTLYIQAEAAEAVSPSFALIEPPQALGRALVPTAAFDRDGPIRDPGCRYAVEVPHDGPWFLWARVRYADTESNSFFYVEKPALQLGAVLGNATGHYGQWFWDGPLPLKLPKGRHVFSIAGRESLPHVSPMLDCLCLADDPGFVPTDAEARRALAGSAKP